LAGRQVSRKPPNVRDGGGTAIVCTDSYSSFRSCLSSRWGGSRTCKRQRGSAKKGHSSARNDPRAGAAVAEFSPSRPGEHAVVVSSARGAHGPYQLTTNYRITDVLGTSDDEIEGPVEVLGVLMMVFWLAPYYGLFTIPGWRHPDRILLLRPFGEPRVSRALKRFNRRSLAYRGFTFTLADKHLKHSLFVFLLANVPLDLGSIVAVLYRPLFRRLHRWVLIQQPRDLAILRLRLRSRWTLTRFWHSWLGLGDASTSSQQ
jgi:hypothetical protein